MSKRFVGVVERIVKAAGLEEDFKNSEHFHVRIPNGSFMDLVIESWPNPNKGEEGRIISVAHYQKANGDLIPDPEIEMMDTGFPISCSQVFGHTAVSWIEDGTRVYSTRQKRSVSELMTMWADNLRFQGFVDAAKKMQKAGKSDAVIKAV